MSTICIKKFLSETLMNFHAFLTVPFILALGTACQPASPSQMKTIFGEHNFRVIEESQVKSGLEKSVGALYLTGYVQKFCTALQIAPRFILTNAHCMKKKDADHYVDFFFTKDYLAQDGQGAQYTADDVFDELYLTFHGAVRYDAVQTPDLQPNLKIRHVATNLDYAILEITDPNFSTDFTSIRQASAVGEQAAELLSFPNAMPLTRSYACTVKPLDAAQLRHDCASAGGSSGGILYDPTTQAPLALHKQGVFYNGAAFYQEHHRSETAVELAQHECQEKYKLEVGSDTYQKCVDYRSQNFAFNRAVPLQKVVESLQKTQGELFTEIFGAE